MNISLPSVRDVERSCTYLGDPTHKNHKNHNVDQPKVYGCDSLPKFIENLDSSLGYLNRELDRRNQLRIAAKWWAFGFGPGSNLSTAEEESYVNVVLKAIGCRSNCTLSWHRHKFNGAADLNIVDPGIDNEPIPTLRRPQRINLLGRVRARSDEWAHEANARRGGEGRTAIPTPLNSQDELRSGRGIVSIEEILASHCRGNEVTLKTLPETLKKAGLRDQEWEITFSNHLILHCDLGRPHRKKKSRSVRINLRSLFAALNLRITLRETVTAENEIDLDTGDQEIRPLWTTVDVTPEQIPAPNPILP